MARVAVLIDRAPNDPEWKGAAAWGIINALAESQHDVQVFTPLPFEALTDVHPRVGLARPSPNFGITRMIHWGRALAQYRPDIIHTFAPRDEGRASLTLWPYLEGLGPVLPGARRITTVFDARDVSPDHVAARWLYGHARWSVFAEDVTLGGDYSGALDRLNIADVLPDAAGGTAVDVEEILIPAPLSEWTDFERDLGQLVRYLREDSTRRVRIVGGWGEVPLARRRRAWTLLSDSVARVHLGEPLGLAEFVRDAAHARDVWDHPLARDSWRARVTKTLGAGTQRSGETINQLSRIYSVPARW